MGVISPQLESLPPGALRIDKSGPVPVYVQIADRIRSVVHTPALPPGAALPPERLLCEAFGVSRMTVRQALNLLEHDGLIRCQRGRGTFVAPRRMDKLQQQMRSFSEEIRARGGVPSSRVLSFSQAIPEAAAREFLGLEDRDNVYELRRLRLADGVPLALETTCVPCRLCPNLHRFDVANQSLYTILEEHYGLRLSRCVEEISAVLPDRQMRALLEIPKTVGVLVIRRRTYADDDTPVEFGRTAYRGDLYTAIVRSVRERGDAAR
jgi:GntR family transcriptional regulator